jgi:cell division protein FtsN
MLRVFFYGSFVISIMTTKLRSLTRHFSLPHLSTFIAISITIIVFCPATTILAEEPQIAEALPPPPPIAQPNFLPADNPSSHQSNGQREYTFSAPDTQKKNNPLGYRVEVFGETENLLTRVRNIEPQAFQKGSIIQVGIFSDRHNAEDLVRKLALLGLWSRIVVNN